MHAAKSAPARICASRAHRWPGACLPICCVVYVHPPDGALTSDKRPYYHLIIII